MGGRAAKRRVEIVRPPLGEVRADLQRRRWKRGSEIDHNLAGPGPRKNSVLPVDPALDLLGGGDAEHDGIAGFGHLARRRRLGRAARQGLLHAGAVAIAENRDVMPRVLQPPNHGASHESEADEPRLSFRHAAVLRRSSPSGVDLFVSYHGAAAAASAPADMHSERFRRLRQVSAGNLFMAGTRRRTALMSGKPQASGPLASGSSPRFPLDWPLDADNRQSSQKALEAKREMSYKSS